MEISALEFTDVHPPRHVNAEFQRAQSAQIDMEAMTRKARGDAEQMRSQAESTQNKLIQEANAYRETLDGQVRAELAEFLDLYKEYEKSPALVWQRMLIETPEAILRNVGSIHFVAPGTRVILDGEKQP